MNFFGMMGWVHLSIHVVLYAPKIRMMPCLGVQIAVMVQQFCVKAVLLRNIKIWSFTASK
jgi:hypothetical protein